MSGKVLIAAPVHPVLTEGLKNAGYSCIVHEAITQEEAKTLLHDCTGVITSTRLLLDRELIDRAPMLQWIGRMGSGMEIIDIEHAAVRRIKCVSSPEGNSNAVAEHALGMLLSLTKRILIGHNEVVNGQWLRDENRGTELEGKTIGIIGFGNTGQSFARKLQGFDMNILAYDKYCKNDNLSYVTVCPHLEPVYAEADIVSFHVPLLPETYHYFNEGFIGRMAKPFVLINTSRGNVVDTEVLLGGLMSGKVTGACLDVIEGEPLQKMPAHQKTVFDKILKFPQTIATPHIAGYSYEAVYKMSAVLLSKIVNGRSENII